MITLAAGFNHKPETHARLLYARLQDDLAGPGAQYINLKLERIPTPEPPQDFPVLPPKAYNQLMIIAHNITTNPTVRDMVESISKLCKNQSLSPQPGRG